MASDLIASSPPIPQHELLFHRTATVTPSEASFMPGPPSVASDGTSVVSAIAAAGLPPYMAAVRPKPDYISQYNASRATTDLYRAQKELDSEDDDNDRDEPDKVEVSEGAVNYMNNFLDKLLHDVLSVAQSTELSKLRTAVASTLRKSLGREAVATADANLEDLLAIESDDEDRPITHGSNAKWNLEYTWKRSRLRVMMRSEKSDFDIEDDEQWVQQEALVSPGRRYSDNATVITLQSEIFLAGVLDFVSDQLLNLAIIPASVRRRRTSKKTPLQQSNPNTLFIEEPDLEKGVLNSSLDKLWRIWRKTQRPRGWSSAGSPRHGYSYSDASSPATTRRGSAWGEGPYHAVQQDLQTPRGMPGEFVETPAVEMPSREVVPDMSEYPEYIIASNIPLPQGQKDVDEIEVPGLAKDPDEWEDDFVEEPRRRSYFPSAHRDPQQKQERPTLGRRRSSSAPAPKARAYNAGAAAALAELNGETSKMDEATVPKPENTFSMTADPSAQVADALNAPTSVDSAGRITAAESQASRDVAIDGTNDRQHDSHKMGAAVGLGVTAAGAAALAASSHPRSGENASPIEDPRDHADGSPKPNRRNREAAVGLGYPNGISIPEEQVKQESPPQPSSQEVSPGRNIARKEIPRVAPAKETAAHGMPAPEGSSKYMSPDDLKLRAASPDGSVLSNVTSEIVSPREFMKKRDLPHTRAGRSDSLPSFNKNKPMPPIQQSIQTMGIQREQGEPSPVSPLSADERAADRLPEQPRSDRNTSPSKEDRIGSRKTSAPAGRLQDDLARARGSPKIRQGSQAEVPTDGSPVHRKESLRRIAVERNGSLVSLVDENTHKIRSKAPVTSSSITSAEDFDSLLNGGETIKMTLSPSSVREAPSAPTSRSGSIDSMAFEKTNGVLRKRQDSDAAKSPSMKSAKSPSIGSSDKSKRGRTGSDATVQSRRSISRPSLRNKSKTRAGLTAREPTVQTDSTRDFADFIRSTGPQREPQTLVPALTSRTSMGSERQSSVAGQGRQPSVAGQGRQPSIAGQGRQPSVAGQGRQPSVAGQGAARPPSQEPQISENTGIKYKRSHAPREARGSEPSGNAGLIDFIRTGPGKPSDNVPSKDIAPFRYSADSEDMKNIQVQSLDDPMAMMNGRNPSISNTDFGGHRSSISTMGTMQTTTTYNSHAPLVSNSARQAPTAPVQNNTTPKVPQKKTKQSSTTVDGDGIRRYRNKDPYAIDFSDDDDEDEDYDEPAPAPISSRPQPPAPNGVSQSTTTDNSSGSLGDFMRDNNISAAMDLSGSNRASNDLPSAPSASRTGPSPAAAKPSIVSPPSASQRRNEAPPASGLALNGVSFQPDHGAVTTSISSGAPPSARPMQAPATNSPAVASHFSNSSGSVPTIGKPSTPGQSGASTPKPAGVIPRNPNRAKFETREPTTRARGGGGSSTRDLADFLRDSGPPEPSPKIGGGGMGGRTGGGAPSPNIGGRGAEKGKEEKKKFWQRKKYLDMP